MNIVLTKNASNMNTFQMRVAKYWNRIPDDVKLSADVDKFKIKLENYKKERFEVKGNYFHSKTKVCECKCIIAVTRYNNYTLYAFQNKYIEYKLLYGNL